MDFMDDIKARGLDQGVRSNTFEIDFEWHRRRAAEARAKAFALAFDAVRKGLAQSLRSLTNWLARADAGRRALPPNVRLG
jgi:hypothetical protein